MPMLILALFFAFVIGCSATNKEPVSPPGPQAVQFAAVTAVSAVTAAAPAPRPEFVASNVCPNPSLPTAAGLPVYYVCDCATGAEAGCVTGSDAGNGLTKSTPWRSYGKARAQFEGGNFPAGATVAFCRGGAWDVTAAEGDSWVNGACTAANPCVIRDYTPGAAPRTTASAPPKLRFAGRNGFKFEDGGDADPEAGVLLLNLELKGTGVDDGVRFFNDQDDVLMCNLLIDSFDIGVHVAGSNTPKPTSNGKNERIVLRNSVVRNCPNQGWLGGGDYSGPEYSTFENNGFGLANLNHNVYLSGRNTVGLHAVGNTLYQSTLRGGKCAGTSLVAHGTHSDMVVSGNFIHEDVGHAEPGCWGIGIDTDGDPTDPTGYPRLRIERNWVQNVGNIGIGAGACTSCIVQNNVVIQEQTRFGSTGIMLSNKPPQPADLHMQDVTVRNNTVLLGAGTTGAGIVLESEGTGHVSANNVVAYLGSSAAFACYSYALPPAAYASINRNVCWTPNAPRAEWERESGQLAPWQASGFDANSTTADPQFTSVKAPYNLRPNASLLVRGGDTTQNPGTDQAGRPRSTSPSIGALEP